jgi:enoyl-CoA hydratase
MLMKIIAEKKGPITVITINRPEVKNALDREATALLAAAFQEFDADPTAKVAVLWGAGGSFCAGADLKELAAGVVYDPWAGSEHGPLGKPLTKPVIAAVSGYACAGGLGVALWCDLRIAEEDACFAVLSRRWGVPMSDGTTVRLPRIIGFGRALDMMLTARKVDAREAEAIGLVNRVVPIGQARAAAEELALQIAAFPQIAMLSDRQSVYEQDGKPLAGAIAREAALSIQARELEAQRGATQFASGAGRHGEVV